MNVWVIAIAIVLLTIAGFVVSAIVTAQEPEKIECSSCDGSCSAEKNCDIATCGAVSGGSCGCGRG